MPQLYDTKRQQNMQLFRNLNTQYADVVRSLMTRAHRPPLVPPEFMCECSDKSCISLITLSIEEFEEISSCDNRYVVLKSHVNNETEDVVDLRGGYAVVSQAIPMG